MNQVTTHLIWCGIDVSKKKLDIAIGPKPPKVKSRQFDNKPGEFQKVLRWALSVAPAGAEVRFCMESTGDYGDELGMFLVEEGYHVSVVNPARIKGFGEYKGYLNKTDRADARTICEFAMCENPTIWDMSDPKRRAVLRLWRRLRQLVKMESAESNRLECPGAIGPACVASSKAMLKAIGEEIRDILDQLSDLVRQVPSLAKDKELIKSLPVLSDISAYAILAEMPSVSEFTRAKDWAAVAGGQPRKRQSGSTLDRTKMVKGGRRVVRATLWMPTLTALKEMPEIRQLYERLRQTKAHTQAMVACERKLIRIVYGVLKSGRPYRKPEAKPA